MELEITIFQYINSLINQSMFFDWLVLFFAQYFQYVLVLVLVFLFFKDREKNQRMIVVGFLAALFSRFIVKPIILLFFSRPRPFILLEESNRLLTTFNFENFQSFPSGHALFLFSLSTVILFFNKRLGIFFLTSSFIIVLARVFAGVHWPSDVLVGGLIGALIGFIFYKVMQRK
ncbi:MAG: phosphatase PAP2 family protein [Bacilli bacterium]